MSRPFTRSLLSLLILWQLLASVIAHPLHMAPAAAEVGSGEVMHDCADMDANEMQRMGHMQVNHAQSSNHVHDCQLGCKCPCSGTPALMLALPALMPGVPEIMPLMDSYLAVHSPAITMPLRPPIT